MSLKPSNALRSGYCATIFFWIAALSDSTYIHVCSVFVLEKGVQLLAVSRTGPWFGQSTDQPPSHTMHVCMLARYTNAR